MMQFDRMELGKQAKELGFVRDTFEKVCRLADVLRFFEGDDMLSEYLALKGGTAINLTILDLPRLSVDIDLDFSKNVAREEMLAIRKSLGSRISRYMVANGYRLSPKSKNHHALDSFVYEYRNAGGMKDNLKMALKNLDRVTKRSITTDLYPVLRHGEKFKLLEIQGEIRKYLSEILIPTVDERIFWESFGKGLYNPQLVFEGEELKRIREHPMALWKCRDKKTDGRMEPDRGKIR